MEVGGRKGYIREEWKKILRTARNSRILHVSLERTNEFISASFNNDLTDSNYITSNDCIIVNDEL